MPEIVTQVKVKKYPNFKGKVWIYRLLFVCLFACYFVICTVTEFSGEYEARGVKFCTVVHRRPGQRISHFGELCSPEALNRTNRRARGARSPRCSVDMRRRKLHVRDAPFVESRGVWT